MKDRARTIQRAVDSVGGSDYAGVEFYALKKCPVCNHRVQDRTLIHFEPLDSCPRILDGCGPTMPHSKVRRQIAFEAAQLMYRRLQNQGRLYI